MIHRHHYGIAVAALLCTTAALAQRAPTAAQLAPGRMEKIVLFFATVSKRTSVGFVTPEMARRYPPQVVAGRAADNVRV